MSTVNDPFLGEIPDDSSVKRFSAGVPLGVLLIGAGLFELAGAFARYATFGPYPGVPSGPNASQPIPGFSLSLYSGLHWGRPSFFLSIAIIIGLGFRLATRFDRASLAFAAGFGASAGVTLAYGFLQWSHHASTYHIGPGFYLLNAGSALVAVVTVLALFLSGSAGPTARVPFRSTLVPAVIGALAVGVSVNMRTVEWPNTPLGRFTPLTLESGIVAVITFAVIAAIPLIGVRIGGRTGANILLGVAASLAISGVGDVVLLLGTRSVVAIVGHLTVGWWLRLLAVILFVVVAIRLRRDGASELGQEGPDVPDVFVHVARESSS